MSAPAQLNRRPIGATVLSLILGWLALAGFGNAVAWRVAPHGFDQPLTPRIATLVEALQSPILPVLALAYGTTALAAAIGIWRMRPWAPSAFLSWSVAVIALFAWMFAIIPSATRWHQLRGISERYVILEGRGRMEVADLPPTEVGPGDVVLIPPLCRQRITNVGDCDLVFLCVCIPGFRLEAYEEC